MPTPQWNLPDPGADDYQPFWRCPDCGREYDDIDDGPCPADDCPSRDAVDDDDEGPEPPYAGYESNAALQRLNEVRRLERERLEAVLRSGGVIE